MAGNRNKNLLFICKEKFKKIWASLKQRRLQRIKRRQRKTFKRVFVYATVGAA